MVALTISLLVEPVKPCLPNKSVLTTEFSPVVTKAALYL